MHVKLAKENLRVQIIITSLSLLLLTVKIVAYFFTHSLAVLTDALESIVNVVAGFIGLYSLYVAAKPRDLDHPYGHGKAEFISAAAEGTLIIAAGILIIYETLTNFFNGEPLQALDTGLWLIGATAFVNYVAGTTCIKIGKKNKSLALQASGKHLQIDTYSTLAIVLGIIAMLIWKVYWIDKIIALGMSAIIIYNGYKILRSSFAGIMDEADLDLLNKFIEVLNQKKVENWIDLHNLRVIKYGSLLHIDCHLTVPWFLNVHEAHREIDSLSDLIKEHFGDAIELFVHTDGCLAISCGICNKNCPERQATFEKKLTWTFDNILSNKKHQLEH
jgi:cation diffusion facilitator family transporter